MEDRQDAPWTFAVEPDATHGDSDGAVLRRSNELMIPWITAVLRYRLPETGNSLRPITDTSAWLGNNQTHEIAPAATFTQWKTEASWLPDQLSARGWQIVVGK
jgi:hypothetical protein